MPSLPCPRLGSIVPACRAVQRDGEPYRHEEAKDFMAREAKLFFIKLGLGCCGFVKFRANITARWIRNARTSRKRHEPEVVRFGRPIQK